MHQTHPTPPETGPMRADQAPTDAVVELSADCLHNAVETQPALAVRLRELGFRPGTRVQIGRTVAGGARVVSMGTARYAVDAHTLRQLEVIPVEA